MPGVAYAQTMSMPVSAVLPVQTVSPAACRSTSLLRGIWVWAGLALAVSTLVRLALLVQARGDVSWGAPLMAGLAWGVFFDAVAAVFVAGPWLVLGWFLPPRGWAWGRRWFVRGVAFVYAGALLFGGVAEWFFWDEFQVRFNFIAVDYLVWTQEVWGNINQSYPMPAIWSGLALLSAAVVVGLERLGVLPWMVAGSDALGRRLLGWLAGAALIAALALGVRQAWLPAFANQFNRELAKNGMFSFGAAFWEMEIDYDRFYRTLPGDEAFVRVRQKLVTPAASSAGPDPRELRRVITREGEEKRWNVIVVCMESLSWDFMARGRDKNNLTPNLDRISREGLYFSNIYATGTRTVRGMEALTLSVPPTPGQAILYRPQSTGLVTLGSLFGERGYDCAFIYGGKGGFDYMNRFFGGNGYRVVDKPTWEKGEVSFETSWGACDEDLFRKVSSEGERAAAAGRPFHHFVMTTSNHRPFQFPDSEVRLKSDTGRHGAVLYADHAVGRFLEEARARPWFERTLFVFCADHCASSAGKTELDARRYRIPAIVWNPGLVPPREYAGLCSQIDLMPTVLGLMNWSYTTRFFGQDLLDPGTAKPERAFISNYQKLGLLGPKELVILKPRQEYSLYSADLKTGDLAPVPDLGPWLDDAAAYYQAASWLFKSGGLSR